MCSRESGREVDQTDRRQQGCLDGADIHQRGPDKSFKRPDIALACLYKKALACPYKKAEGLRDPKDFRGPAYTPSGG